ncbi:glycogenin-1-like isoform X2 [Hyposmocoma kahamanoa]|uniref:glycogenin-1-like isoform X2 n=1 Tax=Hyposmocoma kahamanoa TaxID=1477025 RepID=UPI000E6D6519|nr:glycogenin-1-like isoform X2 [Hyposmocoma kahamanoa]XP_026319452.1 glycogenin-1-like isoform X2 [Hyposmocoma kahamanoa]XP_026319453.1 glycogenin-1-like isoform X2 [Hyposmocoma kahamanoa]
MSNRAWVTLATNDSYGLGALVLAHSLRRAGSTYPAVVLITPSVTEAMRERLNAVFAELINVDVLDSRDATHLALLQRPELGITFTKIHCWSLTQFEKCVFLDADTLIVQNCDELFEREELSAAPDVGWPDCFNSGVFVFTPSADTYSRLISFAQERGSFDGGDQGLLNAFFSDWARGDINKHLPFLYNVTSAAFYSYLPALKHYGQNLKIIHFIGSAKPWLQQFNWQSQSVDAPEHLREFLQLWWDLFVSQVHPQLDTAMESTIEVEEALPEIPEYPEDTEYHYEPILDPGSEFPWHHPESQNQESIEQKHEVDFSQIHDPWMYYRGNILPNVGNSRTQQSAFESQDEINKVLSEYRSPQQEYNPNYFESNEQTIWHQSHQHSQHSHSDHQPSEYHWERHQSHQHSQHAHSDHPSEPSEHQWENSSRHHKFDYYRNATYGTHAHPSYSSEQQWSYGNQSYPDNTNHYHKDNSLQSNSEEHAHGHRYHTENNNSSNSLEPPIRDSLFIQNKEQNGYTHYANAYPESHTQTRLDTRDRQEQKSWVSHTHNEPRPQQVYQLHLDTRNRKQRRPRPNRQHLHTPACGLTNGHSSDTDSEEEYIIPRHPYDGFYLKHRPTIDARGKKICSHEIPPAPSPSPSSSPPPESLPSLESGSVHSEDYHTASECEEQSGVAGNLARVVPGDVGYQREAIDELSRRQGWEAGNIDYMGADSFDNIWAKISQTLNQTRTSPPKQPSPPRKEPSPPKAPEAQPPTAAEPAVAVTAPVATETPEPAVAETPVPAAVETTALAATESSVPAVEETPVLAAAETSAPITAETSASVATKTSVPAAAETPVPAAADTPAPVAVESPATTEAPVPAEIAPVQTETPAPVQEETLAPEQAALQQEVPVPPAEPSLLVEPAAPEAVPSKEAGVAAVLVEPLKLEPEAKPAQSEIPKTTEQVIAIEKTEPVVPPTPPATPKSTPEASPPVLETPLKIEATSVVRSAPAAVESPKAAESAQAVAASPAPAAETPVIPVPPASAPLVATPEKPSETSVASTDSPPLANTPSKEEAPAAPAAKSTEEAAQETRL